MKKTLTKVAAWLSLFAFTISLTAVLTFILSFGIFAFDIWRLKLTDYGISFGGLVHNFSQLMGYLNFPWQSTLQLNNFPVSVNGAQHFRDVKVLFELAWVILVVSAPGAICFYRKLRQSHQRYRLYYPFQWAGIVPLIMAVLASLDFNKFFITFHQLFFNNNDWLFDPALDPVILILPTEFFIHCFVLAFVIFEGIMVVGMIQGRRDAKN